MRRQLHMLVRSRAIVLRTIKYNDSSVIAETYTREQGRVSFIVRIPKTRRATVKSVLFAPLALLDLEWNSRTVVSLQHVRNVRPHVVFASIPYEPVKTCIALFVAELLCNTLRTPVADTDLYDFIETSIHWFDAEHETCTDFHIVFLLHLTHFLGIRPNCDNYAEGRCFDLLNGCFCATRPIHSHILEPDEAAALPLLMRMKYATARHFAFTNAQRRRMLDVLAEYYALHLPSFPALKSLDVLREVFG